MMQILILPSDHQFISQYSNRFAFLNVKIILSHHFYFIEAPFNIFSDSFNLFLFFIYLTFFLLFFLILFSSFWFLFIFSSHESSCQATFCAMTVVFCRRLNWTLLASCLETYTGRLGFGVRDELLALVRMGSEVLPHTTNNTE